MRTAAIVMTCLSISGCDALQSAKQWWEGARMQAAIDARVEHYYAQLRPFERSTLEPFASDEEMVRYFDAVAHMQQWRANVFPNLASLQDLPLLPENPPRRQRPAGLAPLGTHIANSAKTSVEGRFPDRPATRLEHNGRVFALSDNALRSWKADAPAEPSPPVEQITLSAPYLASEQKLEYVDGRGQRREYGRHTTVLSRRLVTHEYLFASGSELIVVGVRLDNGSIAVDRMSLADNGTFQHLRSHSIQLRHGDEGFYRARFIDGALVLYASAPLFGWERSGQRTSIAYALPAAGDASTEPHRVYTLLHAKDVQRPLAHDEGDQFLHMIVRCDLAKPGLACSAKAIPGPRAWEFLVGDTAAYLWITAWRGESRPSVGTYIYRMPFDGGHPTAVRVARESDVRPEGALHEHDGTLHAVAKIDGEVVQLGIPIATFSIGVPDIALR